MLHRTNTAERGRIVVPPPQSYGTYHHFFVSPDLCSLPPPKGITVRSERGQETVKVEALRKPAILCTWDMHGPLPSKG